MPDQETTELIWADFIASGKAALEKGRKTLAEGQFRLALEQCKHFKENDRRIADTLSLLVKCIDIGERPSEAEGIERKILAAREKSNEVSVEDSVTPMESLAFLLARRGELAESLQLQNAVTAMKEKAHGKYAAETLKSLESAYWNMRLYFSDSEADTIKDKLLKRSNICMEQINDLNDKEQYDTAWTLAKIFDNMSMKETSGKILLSCLQYTREKFGVDSREMAECLIKTANSSSVSCEHAVFHLLDAIAILERLDDSESSLLKALNSLCKLSASNNKLENAISARLRIIDLKEQALVCDNYALYPEYQALAMLYIDQERFAEALQAFERAIALIEETTGTGGEDLAQLLKNAAHGLGQENKSAAENFYKRALSTRERIFGFEHQQVAEALSDLGGFYLINDRSSQAEPLFLRALAANRKFYEENHSKVAYIVLSLGTIYSERNDLRAAEEILKPNIKEVERLSNASKQKTPFETGSGFQHFQLGIVSLLANVYLKQLKFADAKPLFQQIVETQKRFGDDIRCFNSLFNLAICNHHLNFFTQAESDYKRCLIMLNKAAHQQPDIKDVVIDRLVEVLRSTNKHLEANELVSCKTESNH